MENANILQQLANHAVNLEIQRQVYVKNVKMDYSYKMENAPKSD